jgi:hypothetical protein
MACAVYASINYTIVFRIWPEVKWYIHDQVDKIFILEDWTRVCCIILGWIVDRGERLNKLDIAGFPRNLFK